MHQNKLNNITRHFHGDESIHNSPVIPIIYNKQQDSFANTISIHNVTENNDEVAIVSGAQAFILSISRIAGLAPVKFTRLTESTKTKSSKWILSLSKIYSVFSCIILTFLICFGIYGLVNQLKMPHTDYSKSKTLTERVVRSGNILVVIITSAIGVYGSPIRFRRIFNVLKLLSSVDKYLGFEVLRSKERIVCLIIVAIFFVWTCIIIDDFCIFAGQMELKNIQFSLIQNYIAFYLMYYVVIVLEIQFAYTAHSLYLRLKKMNSILGDINKNFIIKDNEENLENQSIFTIKKESTNTMKLRVITDNLGLIEENKIRSEDPAESIRIMSKVYGTLCTAVKEVDASFGLPVFIILITTLFHLIVTPYFLILELGDSCRIHYLILQSLWCSAHALRLLLLVEPCHNTKNEASKTADIVSEMLTHWQNDTRILKRLESFSHQLLHRSPNFTALGVCYLERPLIASVTAAVTTYLVILIQFQEDDDLDLDFADKG